MNTDVRKWQLTAQCKTLYEHFVFSLHLLSDEHGDVLSLYEQIVFSLHLPPDELGDVRKEAAYSSVLNPL